MVERPPSVYVRVGAVLLLGVGVLAAVAFGADGIVLDAILVVVFASYTAADAVDGQRRRATGMAVATGGWVGWLLGGVVDVAGVRWAGIAVALLGGLYAFVVGSRDIAGSGATG